MWPRRYAILHPPLYLQVLITISRILQILSNTTAAFWKPEWESLLSNGTVNNPASPPNNLTGIIYGTFVRPLQIYRRLTVTCFHRRLLFYRGGEHACEDELDELLMCFRSRHISCNILTAMLSQCARTIITQKLSTIILFHRCRPSRRVRI